MTVGAVIIGVLGAWFAPKIGARNWYTGKSHTLESRHDVVRAHRMLFPPLFLMILCAWIDPAGVPVSAANCYMGTEMKSEN